MATVNMIEGHLLTPPPNYIIPGGEIGGSGPS